MKLKWVMRVTNFLPNIQNKLNGERNYFEHHSPIFIIVYLLDVALEAHRKLAGGDNLRNKSVLSMRPERTLESPQIFFIEFYIAQLQ